MLSRFRRYGEVYAIMLRNSLIREMAFKANFLLWMGVELLWFIGQIVFIEVIFGYVERIGDWTKWEVVLLVGTHQLIAQIFQAFFYSNLANLPELIRTGRFDFMLLQPIDTQFAVSTKQFGLDNLVNALIGVAFVAAALIKLGVIPTLEQVALYIVAIAMGVMIHYCVLFCLAATSFWIVRSQGLIYGYYSLFNLGRYPDVIFRGLFKFVFSWIIPDHRRDQRAYSSAHSDGGFTRAVAPPTDFGDADRHGRNASVLASGAQALRERKFVTRQLARTFSAERAAFSQEVLHRLLRTSKGNEKTHALLLANSENGAIRLRDAPRPLRDDADSERLRGETVEVHDIFGDERLGNRLIVNRKLSHSNDVEAREFRRHLKIVETFEGKPILLIRSLSPRPHRTGWELLSRRSPQFSKPRSETFPPGQGTSRQAKQPKEESRCRQQRRRGFPPEFDLSRALR